MFDKTGWLKENVTVWKSAKCPTLCEPKYFKIVYISATKCTWGQICLFYYYVLSQPALAWLKIRYYAEVPVFSRTFDVRKYLSLSLPLYGYLLVVGEFSYCDGRGGNWPGFPGKFPGHAFRLWFCISLGEDPWFGWPTGVEDCSFESPWGQADTLGM
jgi:hypothetical protein